MLPSAQVDCVGVLIASFRSSIPSPPIPLFTLRNTPHGALRKTRGRVVRYSFLVGILPPLLHAGLSRRTDTAILRKQSLWHDSSVELEVFNDVRRGQGSCWNPGRLRVHLRCALSRPVFGRCSHRERSGRTSAP